MRWFRFAVLVLLVSVLQTGFADILSVRGVKPDLLLILLVFLASRSSPTETVIASFVIGLMADLINPTRGLMGPRILSFGLFGTLLSDIRGVFSLRRPAHLAGAIFLMGILTGAMYYLLASLRTELAGTSLLVLLLWQPLYSAILGPLFSLPVGWWMSMTGKRSRGHYGPKMSFRR